MAKINVKKDITSRNRQLADELRKRFVAAGTYVINIISSPGSGKTSLIEKMGPQLIDNLSLFVIDGDLETQNDANRLKQAGIPAVQIETHGCCHLDAVMIDKVLVNIDLDRVDLLIIENIGNLICPVGFDLGENMRVVAASPAEGQDKPLKYPQAYHRADVCIFNKIDLLPYIKFDTTQFEADARRANPNLQFFYTSCLTGQGVDNWSQWLLFEVKRHIKANDC